MTGDGGPAAFGPGPDGDPPLPGPDTDAETLRALDDLHAELAPQAAALATLLAEQEGEATQAGREVTRQALHAAMAAKPHDYGFFQAVRLLENAHRHMPRVGTSLRLRDDAFRFGQMPTLAFPPATLSGFEARDGGKPPRLSVRFFGLFGPNGPLPLHLTEFARERARRQPADRALVRFADLFHHRLLSLFYRAWSEAQPVVSLDRPENDPFSRWVGSVAGYGTPALQDRDEVPDGARRAVAGLLGRTVHGAEGFERLLNDFFRVPVRVHQWQPHWMRLPEDARSRVGLAHAPARLGENTVVGARVWDCQTRFRVEIGPLALADYERFLPGGPSMRRLRDWVRNYVGHELSCEMHLVLRAAEVPRIEAGRAGRLGWTTWLGTRSAPTDADDLVVGIT